MLINLRNALMTGKRLPYDAEVEWIGSRGKNCWIDTGYVPTTIPVLEIEASLPYNTIFYFGMRYGVGAFAFKVRNLNELYGELSAAINSNSFTLIGSSNTARFANIDITMDGSNVKCVGGQGYTMTTPVESAMSGNTQSLQIFSALATYSNANVKVSRCTIFDGQTPLHVFVPVRIGQEAAFFDKVQGVFAELHGTFSFGADKN